MEHNEVGYRTSEAPILCVNNCGFFGSAATMNMCSKCHKDIVLKQDQAKIGASSIESIVSGVVGSSEKGPVITMKIDVVDNGSIEHKVISTGTLNIPGSSDSVEAKEGPTRCKTCKKRIGLAGFNCKCGGIFCGLHRYSDKHGCPYDYRTAAQNAIAKANPVIKTDKLDRI